MRSLSLIAAIALVGSTVSAAPHDRRKTTNNNSDVKYTFNMGYSEGQVCKIIHLYEKKKLFLIILRL